MLKTLAEMELENTSRGREADAENLRAAAEEAGSPLKLLQKMLPSLADTHPDLTLPELVAETEAGYLEAERRLVLCARCPPDGGACADTDNCYQPGRQPRWDGRRLVAPVCDRWPEYAIRHRLILSGVPPRQASLSFLEFPQTTPRLIEAHDAAVHWAYSAASSDTWLVLTNTRSEGRHLAVAACRALKKKEPRSHLAFVFVPDLISRLKESFDDKSLDPMYPLSVVPIAVLDGVDPRGEPAWFRRELEKMIRERFHQRRSTLITTTRNLQEMVNAYPSLDGMQCDAVVEQECSL